MCTEYVPAAGAVNCRNASPASVPKSSATTRPARPGEVDGVVGAHGHRLRATEALLRLVLVVVDREGVAHDAVSRLEIPETDRRALWPVYDQYRDRFVALRADCAPGQPVKVTLEEITPPIRD